MIDGSFLIGSRAMTSAQTFHPATPAGNTGPGFAVSSDEDVDAACALADAAFDAFREAPPTQRAAFLDDVAQRIDVLGDGLTECAMAETGLPAQRLNGERARTVGQLRMFAQVVRDGRWAGLVVTPALPDRQPLPRPDLRQRRVPLGPVAVFGASNFPLAFSVAGGDTASAWAAGCPVVVKGHPAHPGTSAMVGRAIQSAVAASGLPEGIFSLLQGPSNALGAALVSDARIKAVGFTGSRAGGLALVALAQARPEPIPVYAEMSSINPVLVLPGAWSRLDELAKEFVDSLTMGAGQFCTNPGILLAIEGPELDRFSATAARRLETIPAQPMLSSGIHQAFEAGAATIERHPAIHVVGRGASTPAPQHGRAAIISVAAADFMADTALAHEVFGAMSIIIRCASIAEMTQTVAGLEGQLTATMHLDEIDLPAARALLPLLERKAGRILVNGWPTGVEVAAAMVHGGPFPATSDARTTSVGTAAIERFLRPVCYQNIPDELLPDALRRANLLGLPFTEA